MIIDGLTSEECISSLEEIKTQYKLGSDVEKIENNLHDQADICFRLSKKASPKYYSYKYDPENNLDPETFIFLKKQTIQQSIKIYEKSDIEKWNDIEYLNNMTYENLDLIYKRGKEINEYQDLINNNINDLLNEIRAKGSKKRFIPMFDLTIKDNCCNCISIILYFQDWYEGNELNRLLNVYLYSMKKSLDVVSNNLENFIIRYYIHTSVFDILKIKEDDDFEKMKIKTDCNEILLYLFKHEQCEIFIYSCEKIIGDFDDTRLSRIRIFRFLHDDINILISREADGIVSISDCNNIKLFMEDRKKILMSYEYAESFQLGDSNINRRYHGTLRSFNNLEDYAYEIKSEKQQYVDFLAGTLAIKIKINPEYIFDIVKEFNKIYVLYCLLRISKKHIHTLKSILEKIDYYDGFNQSFDEIILNNLLKPINTIDILSTYGVLISKKYLLFIPNDRLRINYTNKNENEIIEVNLKDVTVPSEFVLQFADSILKNKNTNLYSNLPILLINKSCRFENNNMYDKIYPENNEKIDHGIKKKKRNKSKRNKSKRNKSRRRLSKI